MDIFEKNIKAIEGSNVALATLLRDTDTTGVELEPTRSGCRTFKFRGRYFHSRYDPVGEAAKQAEELLTKKPDWVALFGLGCGYLLDKLVEEGKEKFVVYEPSLEILKGVLSNIDMSRVLSCKKVFLETEIDSMVTTIRDHLEGDENLVGYQTAAYRHAFPEELAEYTRKVYNAHITNQVSVSTAIASHQMWNENYLGNIESFTTYPPIDTLLDKFKGVPMIIVGAGPSLQKNAHLLKEVKGKALIVAAVTAYKPLLKFGVIPDFVIATEKVDLPEYFTYGEEDKETRFLLGGVSHPNMFARDVKGVFLYFNYYVKLSAEQAGFWGSSYFPASGGSVTTCAFDLGRVFGCDPLILIGQDLSFGGGRTHVNGGVYIEQNVRIDVDRQRIVIEEDYVKPDMTVGKLTNEFELLWLKGLDGKPIPSKFDWVTFHQWFVDQAAEIKKAGLSLGLINATEGGAYIDGMEHITLKEALERHATTPQPIEETISHAEAHRPEIDYKSLIESFTRKKKAVKKSATLAGDIVKEAEGLGRRFKKTGMEPGVIKPVEKIKDLEEKLFEAASGAEFIWDTLSLYTFNLKSYLKEEKSWDSDKQFIKDIDAMAVAYRKVGDTCKESTVMLDDAVKTLKRLSSESASGPETEAGAQEASDAAG